VTAPPAPTATPSPSPSAPAAIRVQARIDIGGREAYGLTADSSAVWAISYQAGTLARVDPASGTVSRTVTVPSAATVLAVDGTLWVAGYAGKAADSGVYRVDPATGRVTPTAVSDEVCCDLAAGGGAIWAIDPGGAVLRIDPASGRVTRRYPVTLDRNAHTNAVHAGDSVWASSDTTPLFRIRTGDGKTERIDVGGGVPFLVRDGLVWGASPTRLWAVDPRTGAVARTVDIPNSMEVLSLGFDQDSMWVGIRHPGYVGAVLRLDQRTGAVLGEIRDVDIPARIVVAFGSVWVTDSGGTTLFRLAAG